MRGDAEILRGGFQAMVSVALAVQRKGKIFAQRQVREEPVAIEDDRDPAIFRRRVADFALVDENRTSIGAIQSRDNAQKRRLARAARP